MDLSNFLTRGEVQARLGVSLRTLQRMVDAKELKQYMRSKPGQPTVAVYDPQNVAAVAKTRDIIPTQPAPAADPPAPLRTDTTWLSIRGAAYLTGLSVAYLKRKIAAGEIPAVQDGRGFKVYRPFILSYIPLETRPAMLEAVQQQPIAIDHAVANSWHSHGLDN